MFHQTLHIGQLTLDNLTANADTIAQYEARSGKSESRGSIRTRSIKFAKHLTKCGLKSGDVIAMVASNNNDVCLPMAAGLYLGVGVYCLDANMSKLEMKALMKVGRPKLIICDFDKIDKVKKSMLPETPIVYMGHKTFGIDLPHISEFYDNDYDVDDFKVSNFDVSKIPAYMVCTSGSMGLPKIVMYSHARANKQLAYINKLYSGQFALKYSLNWISGVLTNLLMLTSDLTMINLDRFDEGEFLEYVGKYKATFALTSPFAVRRIMRHPDFEKADLSTIKYFIITGASIVPDDIEMFRPHLKNGRLINLYGMSEFGTITYEDGPPKKGSCGKISPAMEFKLVDPKTRAIITKPNQKGEIYLRSQGMMDGYYNDPEATAKTIDSEGWMITGDLGRVDEDGYLFVEERIKEVFKYFGCQISPSVMESVLNEILGVEESVVIAVHSISAGWTPGAFIKLTPGSKVTEDDINNYIKENMADYHQLRGGVSFVDSFPMTPSGKIAKRHFSELWKDKVVD